MARGVVREILAGLPPAWCARGADGRPVLSCMHVWLMVPPPGGGRHVCAGVWRVVCLAALVAMDEGRRATNGWRLALKEEDERRRGAAQPAPAPRGQSLVPDMWDRFVSRGGSAPLTADQRDAVRARVERRRERRVVDREERLRAAEGRAVARFYELLTDFVLMGVAPPVWAASPGTEGRLPDDHPFLRPCADGELEVVLPAPAAAAAAAPGGF